MSHSITQRNDMHVNNKTSCRVEHHVIISMYVCSCMHVNHTTCRVGSNSMWCCWHIVLGPTACMFVHVLCSLSSFTVSIHILHSHSPITVSIRCLHSTVRFHILSVSVRCLSPLTVSIHCLQSLSPFAVCLRSMSPFTVSIHCGLVFLDTSTQFYTLQKHQTNTWHFDQSFLLHHITALRMIDICSPPRISAVFVVECWYKCYEWSTFVRHHQCQLYSWWGVDISVTNDRYLFATTVSALIVVGL
jgi:hypothetical protein